MPAVFDAWAALEAISGRGTPRYGGHPTKAAKPSLAGTEGLAAFAALAVSKDQRREARDRAAFLARAAEEAEAALRAPDPELDAERAVLAEHYAEREGGPPPLEAFCFPCGEPVTLDKRVWSDARGWCCSRCYPAESSGDR